MRKFLESSIPILFICTLLGVLLDFLFNGVFKIVWFVVYAPAYVVASIVLVTELSKTRYHFLSKEATAAFLAGALGAHLVWMGHQRQIVYRMMVASVEPLILRSEEWTQQLMVSSEAVSKQLKATATVAGIPVVTQLITDYGCIRHSDILTIAGVDVLSDPEARWTWKIEKKAQEEVSFEGPGNEDKSLPWCRIQFYRNTRR